MIQQSGREIVAFDGNGADSRLPGLEPAQAAPAGAAIARATPRASMCFIMVGLMFLCPGAECRGSARNRM